MRVLTYLLTYLPCSHVFSVHCFITVQTIDNMDNSSAGDDVPRLRVCPVEGCGRRILHVTCHLRTYHCMHKSDASAMYVASLGNTPQRHRRLRKCEVCEKLLRRLDIHLRKTHAMTKEDAAAALRTEIERPPACLSFL